MPEPERNLTSLSDRIDQCMLSDQAGLHRRLRAAFRAGVARGRRREDRQRLEHDIDAAIRRCEARAARCPRPSFLGDLPVIERRAEIARAIEAHPIVIVCGETGSGKTTQLPQICLELGRGRTGMIGHTQPRRIAARTVAARIADELRTPLGQAVGYQVRFSDRTGPDCFIKVMTDGILLAWARSDPRLLRYDTLIIDEAHERSLNIDFLLGYVARLRRRRPDLKVIITSATIDPGRFSDHFGGAPVIEVTGRTHAVEIRYRPLRSGGEEVEDRDVQQGILDAVDEVAAAGPGDVLIFLPGEREIRETAEALRKHHPPQTEILPLYARLSFAEQNRVFQPHGGRRIVLATNVAETSLTVPGIRFVVDSGVARLSRYSSRRRVQVLPIEAISRASADQRAGRCGRLGPGVCIRLYSEQDFQERDAYTDPEILRSNLASVILQMRAMGLGSVQEFPFIDPPRPAMVREGHQTLHELGAMDESEGLTELGRRLAALPIDPRLGRMILAADGEGCLSEVLIIAAALSIQDPRQRPLDQPERADQAQAQFHHPDSDFLALLNVWQFFHEQKKHMSWNKLRICCQEHFLSFMRMREWMDVHQQLKRVVTESGMRLNAAPAAYDTIHRSLLAGLLSSVALRTGGTAYQGAGGKTLHLFPGSGLYRQPPRWIVAGELVETTRLYARTAARVQPAWIERLAGHLIKRKVRNPRFEPRTASVVAEESITLFGLPLASGRRTPYGPVDPVAARELFIQQGLVEGLHQTNASFFEHNRRLIAEIEALQAKRRRRDLLVEFSSRFAFFDRRLPPHVWNGARFHAWRKQAERQDPDLLKMTRADLMLDPDEAAGAQAYPDLLALNGSSFPLAYRLEPGERDDGVTVTVPLEALGQLDVQRLQWLVPGYLEELIVALIRTLPKALRRNFVPAPDFAAACKDRIAFGDGSLLESLSRLLEAMTGIAVPLEAWRAEALPEHLRMNVKVVGADGSALAEGRDVAELRRSVGQEAATALAEVSEERFDRRGVRRWDFGELPEDVVIERRGAALLAFPTLVDEGDAVAIALRGSRAIAERELRDGLRRLLLLQVDEEIEHHVAALPDLETMVLQYALLGPVRELKDELGRLIVDRVFLDGRPLPRSREAFEACLDAGFGTIWDAALEVGQLVAEILRAHQALLIALDRTMPRQWELAVADIQEQRRHLVGPKFLTSTPFRWLVQLPRFLQACEVRFQKLAGGGHVRDEELMVQFAPLWADYQARAEEHRQQGIEDPALVEYRWMLEELRVSLFAQGLGTSIPVSFKRLKKQWQEITR